MVVREIVQARIQNQLDPRGGMEGNWAF